MSRAAGAGFVPFERVAVLGLGLLGGSVALAARARGVAREVVGAGRRRAPLEAALAAGVVDAIAAPEQAVDGADLVVLGTPVPAMAPLLERVAPRLRARAIVTDVGSVKAQVVDTLPGLLPGGARAAHFVGSHPMAGSHLAGVEHAREDLFAGARCVVTPVPDTDARACARIEAFWRALGADVVRRDPEAHDTEVAWTSHLPHLLAFAFGEALRHAPPRAGELAASGFRDFTRIAHSGSELWSEILCTNRKALAGPLQRFQDALSTFARAVESGDAEALERLLASARDTLAEVAASAASRTSAPAQGDRDARSGGENPEIQAAREEAATEGNRNENE